MNNQRLNKLIKEYLKSQHLMCLSTFSDHPWSTTLYYAVDDDLNIYFVSDPKSKHCRDILKNNKVSCAISDSTQKVSSRKIGVQLTGIASRVIEEIEIIYALALWNFSNPGLEKIFKYENLGKINTQVYILRPNNIKFFNEKIFGPEGSRSIKNRDWHSLILKGLVDLESLNKGTMKNLLSTGYFKERNPEGQHTYFYVYKIISKGKTTNRIIGSIQKKLKSGWYAVFWNKKDAYFVFRNKVIKIPHTWTNKDFKKVTKYASTVGIKSVHFNQIKNSMKNW